MFDLNRSEVLFDRVSFTNVENIIVQEGHDGPGVAHLSFPDYEV